MRPALTFDPTIGAGVAALIGRTERVAVAAGSATDAEVEVAVERGATGVADGEGSAVGVNEGAIAVADGKGVVVDANGAR